MTYTSILRPGTRPAQSKQRSLIFFQGKLGRGLIVVSKFQAISVCAMWKRSDKYSFSIALNSDAFSQTTNRMNKTRVYMYVGHMCAISKKRSMHMYICRQCVIIYSSKVCFLGLCQGQSQNLILLCSRVLLRPRTKLTNYS